VIFHSYVSLPEGKNRTDILAMWFLWSKGKLRMKQTKSKANETAIRQQVEPPVKSCRSRLQRVVKIIVHAECAVLWKWHDGNVSWHCLIVAGEAYATMLISVGLISLPIGSMYDIYIYGNIYHQYTPVMLAYIPAPWILWVTESCCFTIPLLFF